MERVTGNKLLEGVDRLMSKGIKVKAAMKELGYNTPAQYYYWKKKLGARPKVKVLTYSGATAKVSHKPKLKISPVHFTAEQVAHLMRVMSNA